MDCKDRSMRCVLRRRPTPIVRRPDNNFIPLCKQRVKLFLFCSVVSACDRAVSRSSASMSARKPANCRYGGYCILLLIALFYLTIVGIPVVRDNSSVLL